jgi:hypothetical protein
LDLKKEIQFQILSRKIHSVRIEWLCYGGGSHGGGWNQGGCSITAIHLSLRPFFFLFLFFFCFLAYDLAPTSLLWLYLFPSRLMFQGKTSD